MTNLYRVRVVLTGFTGAPGVATHYFLDMATALESVHDTWAGIALEMPDVVGIDIPPAGDVINDTNGELVDAWTSDPVDHIVGSDGGTYTGPSGAVIDWDTSQIYDGHRLRGRTFVVPLPSSKYAADGGIQDAARIQIALAATALVESQSASFVIWHRPFPGSPATLSRPARAAHAGNHGLVVSSHVPVKAAVLRSRRD